jgi:cytochrome c
MKRMRCLTHVVRWVAIAALACTPGARHEPGAAEGRQPDRFGFGRPATAAEIRAWDIDVAPDGHGLPLGSGSVAGGAAVYAAKCAACHGVAGAGGPLGPALVGREPRQGFPFGRDPSLVRTIGNYWPYATTLYDYINRAMPLNAPGSLQPYEVYGLVAYLLNLNEIVPRDAVMDAHTLPRVVMPARDRFVLDNRRPGAGAR